MHYTDRYPDNFKRILNNVKEYCEKVLEDRNNKVKLARKDGKFYSRPWWDFIVGIEVYFPLPLGSKCALPSVLRTLSSVTCKGDINATITLLRDYAGIAKSIEVDTKDTSHVKRLEMTCDFILDINRLLTQLEVRPQRKIDRTERKVEIQDLDADYYSCSDEGDINWMFRGNDRVRRITLDFRNAGPGKPNSITAGMCLVCHRCCSKDEFYCKAHRKSIGGENNYKSAQRIITGAFNNLAEELELDVDLVGLNKKERGLKIHQYMNKYYNSTALAFHNKAHQLIGWSHHKPQQVEFIKDINHCIATCGEAVLFTWTDAILKPFQELILITKKHDHTKKIFCSAYYAENDVQLLMEALINQVLDLRGEGEIIKNKNCQKIDFIFDFNFTPLSAITMICRMGQFNLIKREAKKKLIYS